MLGIMTTSYFPKLNRNNKKEIEKRVKLHYLSEYYDRRTGFSTQKGLAGKELLC